MNRVSLVIRTVALIACVGLIALPSFAQNPTGKLTGRATTDGEALPGVTVSISSDALPGGSQIAVTGGSGDYIFHFLPAGTYTVTFALDGFVSLETEVKISSAQDRRLDAQMEGATVSEEIVVTGAYETVTTDTQTSVTFDSELVESLPIVRNMKNVALMAPGVSANAGNEDALNIMGAPGPQSLLMVNGVAVNDTIFGNAFELYVEDAVLETTTSITGVSAEYGRFAGGVVNMVTKSGGNEFSGSYRLSLTNEAWEGKTPLTTLQSDEVNQRHEATFGGYLMKDHLWFFLAGRSQERSQQDQTFNDLPFSNVRDQQRYEAKLTVAPHISHRILGSYMKVEDVESNYSRLPVVDELALIDRETPQETFALNYTGVITQSFFVEAQYSERTFQFIGGGGDYTQDLAADTPILHWRGSIPMANTHIFCNGCPGGDGERNNEEFLLKGSLFLSSGRLGSHDIVFGYDSYNDVFLSNNYQSPSNFRVDIFNDPVYSDGDYYPMISAGNNRLIYFPILLLSEGTDFTTDSLFVNDTWRMNKHWTFNLGLRYDKNDAQDGSGSTVGNDSNISPRMGVSWDPRGDGEWIVNLSFSRYVAMLDAGKGGSGGGGKASELGYNYEGPNINIDEEGNFVPMYNSYEAMAIYHEWFASVGGLSNTDLWRWSPSLAGYNLIVPALSSPYTDEIALGFVKRLGTKGLIRTDYAWRESGDFYMSRIDTTTGQVYPAVEIAPGVIISEGFDLEVYENDNSIMSRTYHGLHTQLQYRFTDRLTVGGNWTWSHLYGNFDGENTRNGISVGWALSYPEYIEEEWSYPTGDLGQDQRHKINAYLVWDIFSGRRQNLTFSWLERWATGTPYDGISQIDPTPYVNNPGYLNPSTDRDYYFTAKGAYTTDSIHSTDLALNYSFFINAFGGQIELYVQPEVQNLFNESGVLTPNNTVVSLAAFDPFTETPVEGVNYDFGSNFGNADIEDDFQLPRRFRISVGVRF